MYDCLSLRVDTEVAEFCEYVLHATDLLRNLSPCPHVEVFT